MSEEILEATPETEVKAKRGRKPKAAKAEVSDNSLVEMMMEKFKEMMQQNADNTLSLAESLRKPTELEQQKLDQERDSRIKRHEMSVRVARQQEAIKNAKINECRSKNHSDKLGNHLFRGQIHSDGCIHPICQRCRLEMPPIKANPGQAGAGMEEWTGVTEETLRNMARISQGAA